MTFANVESNCYYHLKLFVLLNVTHQVLYFYLVILMNEK